MTYRTRNARTGLSLFALRIYRDRPGSPQFEGMVREAATASFSSAAMNAAGESERVIPPLEVYEQNGGLIGLERVVADDAPAGPRAVIDRRQERLAEARALRLERRPADALVIYESLLAGRECDTRLLQQKSLALWETGDHQAARAVALHALDLEPHETSLYRQLAVFHTLDRLPHAAFDILVWGTSRYCDFTTWAQMTELAVALDRTGDAAALLDRGLWRLTGLGDWAGRVRESRARTDAYRDALAPAAPLQRCGTWPEALAHCERAIGLARSDVLARLNAAICCFHLGALARAIELAAPTVAELHGQPALSAMALLLMALARSSDWESARTWALGIRDRVGSDPFDLPTIPIVVSDVVREQSSVIPVLNVLRELQRRIGMPLPERARLQTLVELYVRRATKTDDLPPEPEWVRKL